MELRKKGIYRNAIRSKLGDTTEAIPGITDNSYDIVIMAGGFAHGHLNIQVLWQAARALKKGTHMMLLPRNIGITGPISSITITSYIFYLPFQVVFLLTV